MTLLNFSSDNNAGAHPEVLAAVTRANEGMTPAYGDDPWTERATALMRKEFGEDASIHFVYGGTGANVLGLQAMTRQHHGIVCAESAHIAVDECGAPGRFTGCQLLPQPTPDGKLTPDQVLRIAATPSSQHWTLPRVVSVSQQSECGTVYTVDELRALAVTAHAHDMLLHVDGARLANAAAALKVSLAALTRDAGVDVFSFGGTKNGLLFGEAIVFLHPELAKDFLYLRKQGMQLASKMRFIGAQFEALFTDELWLRNARHANAMAGRLREAVHDLPGLRFKWPVQGSTLFPILPHRALASLQRECVFEVWNPEESLARWMTSWATTPEEVDVFAERVRVAFEVR